MAEEGKKWDGDGVPLEDSNMAGIGTDEDKALRKQAASTEPAWEGVGLEKGLWVWRIEQFQVVPWPRERYGEFHMGDSYIVLHVDQGEDENMPLDRQIYFWLGKQTSIDERGTAAYKTVELDDFFDGACGQNREVMNKESEEFLEIFPKRVLLKGGVDSGFNITQKDIYMAKLLQVRQTKKKAMVADEVTLELSSLNHRDCFILDAGDKVYLWNGDDASAFLKHDANARAKQMESERGGFVEVLYEPDEKFWELLGGKGDIVGASAAPDVDEEPDFGDGILYKVSVEKGSIEVEQVGRRDLDRSMLDTTAVMMLDTRTEIFLWMGKQSPVKVRNNAFRTAINYLKTNGRDPEDTAIHMFKEGGGQKNKVWKGIFGAGPAMRTTGAAGGTAEADKCCCVVS